MAAFGRMSAIAAVFAASLMAIPPADAQSRPTTIALSPYLGVLWSFEAELGGKQHVFLFDTGGGITVLTPESARDIGCAPWGQLTGFRMRGDRVDMARCDGVTVRSGGAALTTATAGVFDFSKLLPKDAPPLAGSIALDSFAGKIVTIDLGHRQIILETAASLKRRIAGAREVELHLAGEVQGHAVTPFLAVQTPKGKVWLEIDTGSNSSVIVASHNAPLFAMKPDSKEPQAFRGAVVGGVALAADDAQAMPLVLDGNIGAAILKSWIVTIDTTRGRAWISPAAGY